MLLSPAFSAGNVAIITGAASGIGLAAAVKCAGLGMKVCLVDLPGPKLDDAAHVVAKSASKRDDVVSFSCDVSSADEVATLDSTVEERFGTPSVLMNNAGIQPGSTMFGADGNWRRILEVNLGGAINGCHRFGPKMLASGKPGVIINTGSKQGITTPPGDPAYNVSKAALKAFTEALEHECRNTTGSQVSAHLLIPGFVYTPLTANGRSEKPAAAWTPEQTVDFLFASLERGDFYILCPDNDVDRALDEKRMAWAIGDVIHNRPPLSRWHPDYKDAFAAYLQR
jgi:NAD(P)-dependent dehydrogenase (short-subunit alcohol dehydrogenase family)